MRSPASSATSRSRWRSPASAATARAPSRGPNASPARPAAAGPAAAGLAQRLRRVRPHPGLPDLPRSGSIVETPCTAATGTAARRASGARGRDPGRDPRRPADPDQRRRPRGHARRPRRRRLRRGARRPRSALRARRRRHPRRVDLTIVQAAMGARSRSRRSRATPSSTSARHPAGRRARPARARGCRPTALRARRPPRARERRVPRRLTDEQRELLDASRRSPRGHLPTRRGLLREAQKRAPLSLPRVSVTVPAAGAEEARAVMLELFPEGFEELEATAGSRSRPTRTPPARKGSGRRSAALPSPTSRRTGRTVGASSTSPFASAGSGSARPGRSRTRTRSRS